MNLFMQFLYTIIIADEVAIQAHLAHPMRAPMITRIKNTQVRNK